jgi:hypothetical protein
MRIYHIMDMVKHRMDRFFGREFMEPPALIRHFHHTGNAFRDLKTANYPDKVSTRHAYANGNSNKFILIENITYHSQPS